MVTQLNCFYHLVIKFICDLIKHALFIYFFDSDCALNYKSMLNEITRISLNSLINQNYSCSNAIKPRKPQLSDEEKPVTHKEVSFPLILVIHILVC